MPKAEEWATVETARYGSTAAPCCMRVNVCVWRTAWKPSEGGPCRASWSAKSGPFNPLSCLAISCNLTNLVDRRVQLVTAMFSQSRCLVVQTGVK